MKFYLKSGFGYKTKEPTKGDIDLEKLIRDTMIKLGVPVVDPCCDAINASQTSTAVRYNPDTPGLEYYDATSKTWKAVA